MKNNMKFWNELPTWSKGVIAVGGLAVLYFGITATLKRFKRAAEAQKNREIIDRVDDDIKKLEDGGMKLTYPNSQYIQWADSLSKTFDGCDWEQPLFPAGFNAWLPIGFTGWSGSGAKLANIIIKMKNDLDFAKLLSAYGIRTYDKCGVLTGDFTGSLPAAVTDELNQYEIEAINNYLKAQKINYLF